MSTTLISFLGRAPKGESGYRATRYRFADAQTRPVAFFGWALRERIAPSRMVILGTEGSMWDHLFEGDIALGDAREAERLALIAAVEQKKVTQAQLDALAPALAQVLGCELHLAIIPYARNHEEQVDILRIIDRHVGEADSVHLDVSHGFRHLPMLALLSALHLRIARRARIAGIWYGAYDPDTADAPVHELSGLLAIADGLQALASFDKDGDYGVFVPILANAGLSDAGSRALQAAAYYENILNVGEAAGKLRQARRELKTATLRPDGRLLLPAIEARLAWLDEDRQFEKQTWLARLALERRDYLRATLYAFEAIITRLCQVAKVPINDYAEREKARKRYEDAIKNARDDEYDDYRLLKDLRNQVAHGTRGSRGKVQKALLDEQTMREALERIIGRIENRTLPKTGTSTKAA